MFGFIYRVVTWPIRIAWSVLRVPLRWVGFVKDNRVPNTDLSLVLVTFIPALWQNKKAFIKTCYDIFGGDFQYLLHGKKVPYTGKTYEECVSAWGYDKECFFDNMHDLFEKIEIDMEEDDEGDFVLRRHSTVQALVTENMLKAMIKSKAFRIIRYIKYTSGVQNLAIKNRSFSIRRAAIHNALIEQNKGIQCRACSAEVPQTISKDLTMCTNCDSELIDVVEGSFDTTKAQREINKHLSEFYKEIGYVA